MTDSCHQTLWNAWTRDLSIHAGSIIWVVVIRVFGLLVFALALAMGISFVQSFDKTCIVVLARI